MRQPEATKEKILKQSGNLFNTQGYKATSLSDITTATGLTKGAIYRHFKNKDQLEKEALAYLSGTLYEKLRTRISSQPTAPLKLRAIFSFFESYISSPPIKGGCPLLNVSTEVDDTHPILRKQAVAVLDILHGSVVRILENGVKYSQLKPGFDCAAYASVIIATLEGAIMMSKLRNNNLDILTATRHLDQMIKDIEM